MKKLTYANVQHHFDKISIHRVDQELKFDINWYYYPNMIFMIMMRVWKKLQIARAMLAHILKCPLKGKDM